MTGPVTFSARRPRSHLLLLGFVHSVRDADRTTGETWARWRRLGEARADVRVDHCEDVERSLDLTPYVRTSGFEDLSGWAGAIVEHHGASPDDLRGLAVFRVELLNYR